MIFLKSSDPSFQSTEDRPIPGDWTLNNTNGDV